ncbi:hypothetical protein ElyMa_005081500 [Elysia marginata]|uniref:Uncharacterized protein n=1 Tax=Elysia marginata TaxID=1093978 RepID=A0AAV4JK84_9GAST|nr:hypothetical protein ElyMa_005081500 [Elysia marginata]
MKTVLLICLAVAVFTLAAVADKTTCISHVRGEPGTPCRGKRYIRNRASRTTFCCQYDYLYPMLSTVDGVQTCKCVSLNLLCELRPNRC